MLDADAQQRRRHECRLGRVGELDAHNGRWNADQFGSRLSSTKEKITWHEAI